MVQPIRFHHLVILITAMTLSLLPIQTVSAEPQGQLVMFYAGSLSMPFNDMEKAFEAAYPKVDLLREGSGSTQVARKVTDLKKPCDIVASADYKVIDKLLIPDFADWNIRFLPTVFGTPLAYILARRSFPGKRLIEGIIDIPIVIPHPVVGITILGIVGRNHWLGQILEALGIRIMGSVAGIIAVLTFVGMPFYIH